ncbi:MAG TPA: hypothetical protein DCP08_10260 [Chloroflexi bacterium]|nr:hypothetical protein [Chloroflexota bacterium]
MATNETKVQGESLEELLQELIFWVRFSVRDEARQWFEETLKKDEQKWVYEAFDGRASWGDIQKTTGVARSTIRDWGRQWEELGIVRGRGEEQERRICRIVPLRSVGIEVPPLPKQKEE